VINKVDESVNAFRAMLEKLMAEPGVETNVPFLEITNLISIATGRPTNITVTETLWPGSEDYRSIWSKEDAE
jgi:hypothetical protein